MSSESGILADHLNEDNLNDDQITEDDPKQNSSSPELLLEAIRRIGRDKLRNIMLDLSFGSKSAQIRPFFINLDHFGSKLVIFGPKTAKKRTFSGHLFQKPPFWQHFGPKSTKTGLFDPRKVCNLRRAIWRTRTTFLKHHQKSAFHALVRTNHREKMSQSKILKIRPEKIRPKIF